MANWCFNSLTITPSKNNLSKFVEDFKNLGITDSIFEGLIGVKENFKEHFGTKWDIPKSDINNIDDEDIDLWDDFVLLEFHTAWTPCEGFTRDLSEKYGLEIKHFYSEPGCDFSGEYLYLDGELKNHTEYNNYYEGIYNNDYDEFSMLVEELIEYDGITKDDFLERFSFLPSNEIDEFLDLFKEETE